MSRRGALHHHPTQCLRVYEGVQRQARTVCEARGCLLILPNNRAHHKHAKFGMTGGQSVRSRLTAAHRRDMVDLKQPRMHESRAMHRCHAAHLYSQCIRRQPHAEANIPTKETEARAEAWVPPSDAYKERPQCHSASSREGAEAVDGVERRTRTSAWTMQMGGWTSPRAQAVLPYAPRAAPSFEAARC